jgi:hypothetical protein
MIRFFVWQIGTAGFVAVIWRYGYWREILPLAVLGSAFLWIVCGGILLSRGGRKGARLAHDSPVDADAASRAIANTPMLAELAARQHARNVEGMSRDLGREPRFPGSEK